MSDLKPRFVWDENSPMAKMVEVKPVEQKKGDHQDDGRQKERQ